MTNLLLLGFMSSSSGWIIILLVILLLSGGKKIPELMRGLDRGAKSFRRGVNEAKEEINRAKNEIDGSSDTERGSKQFFCSLHLYPCIMTEDKELTFWDHLDELRRVLFRMIAVWFVLAVGCFIATPYLFDSVVLVPCHDNFISYDLLREIERTFNLTDEFFTRDFRVKLVNISLAAPFLIHISAALWMSVITVMPYLFFEIWRLISPALCPNERKGVQKALAIGTVMFFIGVLLGYFMAYLLTLRFLSTYQLSAEVENQVSLDSYIDNFMTSVSCIGLAFELPLLTWLLSLSRLVNEPSLRKYRRHAVVTVVIATAVITPTGDPLTPSAVAIPLYLLYEMSILVIKDRKMANP